MPSVDHPEGATVLMRYPQKCNCTSWQKLFAGKNFLKILVTAQTQLRSYSEQQRAFGKSNICNWKEIDRPNASTLQILWQGHVWNLLFHFCQLWAVKHVLMYNLSRCCMTYKSFIVKLCNFVLMFGALQFVAGTIDHNHNAGSVVIELSNWLWVLNDFIMLNDYSSIVMISFKASCVTNNEQWVYVWGLGLWVGV